MTSPAPRSLRRASTVAATGFAILFTAMLGAGVGIAVLGDAAPAKADPPIVAFPTPGSTVPGNDFTASGTSNEPFDITIRMNADPTDRCIIAAGVGTWSWECAVTGLSGGSQTLRVIQNGVEHTVSFTLEGAPLTVAFPIDGGAVYGSLDSARGTGDSGDSVFFEIDGGAWCATGAPADPGDAWSCAGAPLAAPGAHTFSVFQAAKTVAGSFTVHATLPAPATHNGGGVVERVAADLASGLTVTGTGEYYSEEPVEVVSSIYAQPYTPGDSSLHSCTTTPASDGTWSCLFATVPPDGSYALGVQQSLPATGSTDGPTVTLTIDSTAPPAPPPPAPVAIVPPPVAAEVENPTEPEPTATPAPTTPPTVATPAPASPTEPAAGDTSLGSGVQHPGPGWNDPTVVGSTLRTVAEFDLQPSTIATAAGIAAGLVLLIVFPARLLDSTIRSNYQRAFNWLERLLSRARRARQTMEASRALRRSVTAAMLLGSAVLLGFTDPGFGLNAASLRLTIALAVTVAVLALVRGLATGALAQRLWSVDWRLSLRPGGILMLIVGVLITRLLGLEPGILLGVWLGASLSRYLGVEREAKLVLATTSMVTALGLTAWLGYSLVTPIATADPGFGILLAQEVFATITLKSLATFVVLLLPLTFLDGKTLWDWSRIGWFVTYLALAFVFALIVLPLPGQWSQLETPTVLLVSVFGGFALLSLAVWAWFRMRYPPSPAAVRRRQ
ncbi:MAG: hypothetical protein KF680_04230 [Cryobacterium sp.]|nr:hypothetical protein [Cryobacterium sp.]